MRRKVSIRSKLFRMGQLVLTRDVNDTVAENLRFSAFVLRCVRRHLHGDWGDMTPEDQRENAYSVGKHLRIFSSYKLPDGIKGTDGKLWVITEADRSATTVLWPSEY